MAAAAAMCLLVVHVDSRAMAMNTVASLPLGTPVELEVILEVSE